MHDELITQFFAKYPTITYQKGEKILRPNEYFEHIYMVKSGYARIFKLLKTGQEITLNWYNPALQPIVIFGYTTRLSEYYVEAYTDLVLHRAPKDDFRKFMDEYPEVREHMINDLIIYMSEVLKQVEWLSIPDAYTRIKVVLYTFAYRANVIEKDKVEKGIKLSLRVTHQLIASYTGLSRETVTIQINKLISQGYISKNNNEIVIEDLDGLVATIR